MQTQVGIWKRLIRSLYSGGQMQTQLGIWKRFIVSLLGWAVSASSGDLEEVY